MGNNFGFEHLWLDKQSDRTLLLLHGTGGDEADLVPIAEALDPDANLLSPRGRVSEGGANRFFRRFAEGVFDEDNLRQEVAALACFVREAAGHYKIDPATLTAIGFSNGANTGAALMLLEPDVLTGGVLIRAMVPIVPEALPDLTGRRALILTGDHDPMMPIESATRLAQMLRDAGAGVDHEVLGAGHGLTREDVDLAKAWLEASP